jgi:UDP-N-acetylmuramate dehydrogenase
LINLDDIRRSFSGRIAISEPLDKYTTFRIGGPADIYLEPEEKQDAVALIRHLRREGIPFFLMGNGSNLLVADEGIRGAVVNLEHGFNYAHAADDGVITAGAGIRLAKFVDFCIGRGCRGAEMLAGIPGTLGGGIIMNAGAYGGEISDHLLAVEVIRGERLVSVAKEQAGFAYRTSSLAGDVVLEASFRFPEGSADEMKTIRRETMLKRNRSQPVQFPNAGSIFKNPPGDYAARLIEGSGLKGRRVGNAEISELHANFIINVGGASAHDVLALAAIARDEVWRRFGVALELEIKPIGFDAGTLLAFNNEPSDARPQEARPQDS